VNRQVFLRRGFHGVRDWAVRLAGTLRGVARAGVRPGARTVGIGALPGVHMSPRIFATLQAGSADAPRLSALTPLDEMVAALNAYQPEFVPRLPERRGAASGPPVPDRARRRRTRGAGRARRGRAPTDTPERVRAAVLSVLDAAGAVAPPVRVTPVAELEREPGAAAKLKLIVPR
jgi:hypothetical protein